MLDIDLSGHVAIVTGANHGIGAATARQLAGAGASVLITFLRLVDETDPGIPETYRANRAADASRVMNEIVELGGSAMAVEADLANPNTPSRLFDAAESELGPVDILINNATGWIADTFVDTDTDRLERQLRKVSSETLDQVFGVDTRGPALMISEYSARHTAHDLDWGRIVGLTSGGPMGFPEEVSYGAAKAALENFTMSAAFELADRGITANVVHPPVTDTGWVTNEVRQFVATHQDLINIATPHQVAEVIAFLCSDEAHLITANRIHLR